VTPDATLTYLLFYATMKLFFDLFFTHTLHKNDCFVSRE